MLAIYESKTIVKHRIERNEKNPYGVQRLASKLGKISKKSIFSFRLKILRLKAQGGSHQESPGHIYSIKASLHHLWFLKITAMQGFLPIFLSLIVGIHS